MANTFKFGNGQWATQEGLALAYNDENDNYKPLPFDFTRASTATRVNKQGLIETVASGLPRIDYLNNTNGALLLEPSRTNLVTKSENIQNWNRASNATAEFGYQDPFKGNKAVKLTSSTNAQAYQVYQSTSALSSGTTYTFSMYAKKGSGYLFRLDFAIPSNGSVVIDLRDGSLVSEGGTGYVSYDVESVSNGWYRISMTGTFSASAYYRAGLSNQQGDCYVAFAQIEAGTYATSFIPTSGSAVTRSAETCNNAGNDQVINSTEGVLYAEIKALANDLTYRGISISDGTANNVVRIYYENISNRLTAQIKNGGVAQASMQHTFTDITNNSKIAVKYKQNDFALWIDGTQVATDTSGSTPTNLDVLQLDTGAGSDDFYGKVRDIRVYNTALTDQELQALTS